MSILLWIIIILVLYIAYTFAIAWKNYKANIAKISHIPGTSFFFEPMSILWMILAEIAPNFTRNFVPIFFHEPHYSVQIYNGQPIFRRSSHKYNFLFLRDVELIRACALSKDWEKPLFLYESLDYFGKNITTSNGEEWKRHRKICNPAFSAENLKYVNKVTKRYLHTLFNVWDNLLDKNGGEAIFEINDYMTKMALSVFGTAGFGIDMTGIIEDKHEEYNMNERLPFHEAFRIVSSKLLLYVAIPPWLSRNIPFFGFPMMKKAFDDLFLHLTEMIEKASKDQSPKTHNDILSLLIKANQEDNILSYEDLRSNGFNFFLAGHETTAHNMMFAFSFLASHPEVQEKVVEEYFRIKGDKEEVDYDDIKSMTYTIAVFKESLRLIPSVIGIPKISTADSYLGEYFVPKGTMVLIDTPNLHRNPKYWKNPDEFNPERWLTDTIVPHSFAPFSLGSRACMGNKFAEVESTLIIALTLSNYKLSQPPGQTEPDMSQVKMIFTSTPKHPIKIKFTRRN